jgi:hypothetical protein
LGTSNDTKVDKAYDTAIEAFVRSIKRPNEKCVEVYGAPVDSPIFMCPKCRTRSVEVHLLSII